jgi:hypothetical protein
MNELNTRIMYVGPPQAEEFKYGKSLYLSNHEELALFSYEFVF